MKSINHFIDPNLKGENIKNGIYIYGILGTYVGSSSENQGTVPSSSGLCNIQWITSKYDASDTRFRTTTLLGLVIQLSNGEWVGLAAYIDENNGNYFYYFCAFIHLKENNGKVETINSILNTYNAGHSTSSSGRTTIANIGYKIYDPDTNCIYMGFMASNKYDNTIDVAGQLIYNVNTHTVSTAGSANPPRNSVGVEGMQRQDYPNAIDLTDTVVSIGGNDFYFKMQSTGLGSTGSLTNYVISGLSWDTTV